MASNVLNLPQFERPASESPERRGHILDTAERLFADAGFAATSMRRIADEAKVNVATVYYHCGSKEQLFGAIYGRAIERLLEFVGGTLSAGGEFSDIVSRVVD